MTTEMKEKVMQLKKQGYGYKKISKELSIPLPSVISAIKRNSEEKEICKNCGIRIKSAEGKKRKLFCSDRCRMEWWNSHKDDVNKKALYSMVCKHCGKMFTSYGNKNRKYCCHECYVKERAKKEGILNGQNWH